MIIKGNATQTDHLTKWLNYSDTLIAYVNNAGAIISTNSMISPSIIIGGTPAGGTDGTFDIVNNDNSLSILSASVSGLYFINAAISMQTTGTLSVLLPSDNIGTIVRGYSGQSANLSEWRDSSDTVLANITVGGDFATIANIQGNIVSNRSQTIGGSLWSDYGTIFMKDASDVVKITLNADDGSITSNISVVNSKLCVANESQSVDTVISTFPIYDVSGTLIGYVPIYSILV